MGASVKVNRRSQGIFGPPHRALAAKVVSSTSTERGPDAAETRNFHRTGARRELPPPLLPLWRHRPVAVNAGRPWCTHKLSCCRTWRRRHWSSFKGVPHKKMASRLRTGVLLALLSAPSTLGWATSCSRIPLPAFLPLSHHGGGSLLTSNARGATCGSRRARGVVAEGTAGLVMKDHVAPVSPDKPDPLTLKPLLPHTISCWLLDPCAGGCMSAMSASAQATPLCLIALTRSVQARARARRRG